MEAFTKIKSEAKKEVINSEESDNYDLPLREELWNYRIRENGAESANAQCASPSPTKRASKKRNHANSSSQKKGFVLTELDSVKKKLNFDGTVVANQRHENTTVLRNLNNDRPSILKMR
jgi:hypothetical protein